MLNKVKVFKILVKSFGLLYLGVIRKIVVFGCLIKWVWFFIIKNLVILWG